jgi:hypothetical protein
VQEILDAREPALERRETLSEFVARHLRPAGQLGPGLLSASRQLLASALAAPGKLIAGLAASPCDLIEELRRALARDRDRSGADLTARHGERPVDRGAQGIAHPTARPGRIGHH